MYSKNLIKLIKFFVFLTVIAAPLFYLKRGVYPYTLSKSAFFQGLVEIIFFLWLPFAIFDKRYRPRRTPLMIALGVFLLILTATSLIGVDPWRSFWSTQERAEGVVSILHFAALSLVISSLGKEINWKKLFYASLVTSSVISVIGFIQLKIPNLLLEEPVGNRPGSTFGNPTFLAGYLLFNVILGLYFLLKYYEADGSGTLKKNRALEIIFIFLALLINTAAIFNTQTRGDILGLLVGIVVVFLVFVIEPPPLRAMFLRKRAFFVSVTVLLMLSAAAFYFTRGSSFWRAIPGVSRFTDISLSNKDLSPRLAALKAAWLGFLERPLTGWGWENFNVVYNKHYDPKTLELSYQETRFDKPHNGILEYLVAGGAPLLLAFLILFGVFSYQAWKIKDPVLGQVVIGALTAYLARTLFVFDTLGPLLMFYLLLGLVDGRYRDQAIAPAVQNSRRAPEVAVKGWVIVLLVLIALIPLYSFQVSTIEASYRQFWGFQYFIQKKTDKAVQSFKDAVGLWSPYQDDFKRDYATAVSEAYFYNREFFPKEEARLGIRAMEEVVADHPWDAYDHYSLVDMYNQVSDIDPQKILPAAEREAKIAFDLSPNRQEVYFSLAKTKSLEGDNKAALEILKKALDLDPNVPDAHFYYGLIAYTAEERELGYQELKRAVALGRRWKNYLEPRVVANFFADFARYDVDKIDHARAMKIYDEALGLYQESLDGHPDEEVMIKIGVIYYFKGDRVKARDEILKAMSTTNITKSPSYQSLLPILRDLGISA